MTKDPTDDKFFPFDVGPTVLNLTGDSEIAIADGGHLALNGNLSGAADITKTGAGTLDLSGANGAWMGDLVVQEGRVKFESANALSSTTTLVLADNTRADFRSDSETFGALQGSGTVLLGASNPLVDRQVVVGVNNHNTVFTGTIPSPTGSLSKGGTGIMTLGQGASVDVAQLQSRDGGSLVINGGAIRVGLLDTAADVGPFGTIRGSTIRIEGGVIIASNVIVNPSDRVEIAGGSLSTDQTIAVDNSLLQITGGTVSAAQIDVLNRSQFVFAGGVLHVQTFNGDLTNQGGVLAPGESAGGTVIAGDYTQQAMAKLAIEIGGTTPISQFDRLGVSGEATLEGTLDITLIDLGSGVFQPSPTDSFTIVTSAALSGALDNVASGARLTTSGRLGSFLVHYGPGGSFDPHHVVLSEFLPAMALGDVNLDGQVNGLDVGPFVEVLISGPYQLEADVNEDDQVNGLDVDPFVDAVVNGGGVSTVPEPSTLVLVIAGLLALASGALGGTGRHRHG